MCSGLEECLCAVYTEFDVPADRLVNSPELRAKFAAEVRSRAGDDSMTDQEIMHRLLNLRRAAKLPRLRRVKRDTGS